MVEAAPPSVVRLDVWLDVACLFKTRAEAQRACRGGKVEVGGVVLGHPRTPVRDVDPQEAVEGKADDADIGIGKSVFRICLDFQA